MPGSQRTFTESLASRGGWLVLIVSGICTVVAIMFGAWPWAFLRDTQTIEKVRNLVLAAAVPPSVVMALWRVSVAQQNADSARRDAKTARESLFAERYQRGIELFDNKERHVRIGAVHVLRDLAIEDSDAYLRPVFRLLCAYARHPPLGSVPKQLNAEEHLENTKPGEALIPSNSEVSDDVFEAVLAVDALAKLDQRLQGQMNLKLDLRGAFLQRAIFDDIHLKCSLLDHAILNGAQFWNLDLTKADLTFTELLGSFFDSVDLTGARLDRAFLHGARFSDCDLTGAQLFGAALENTVFTGATLTSTKFSQDFTEHDYIALPDDFVRIEDGRTFVVARGLTQAQLDGTFADPARPPMLKGVRDEETGLPLKWDPREHIKPASA